MKNIHYRKNAGVRQELLQFKANTRQSREERRDRNTRIAFVCVAAAMSIALTVVLTHFVARKLFYENQGYVLKHLIIQTDGQMTVGQIREYAGVSKGENLFAIDLSEVRRRLESVPHIKAAEIRRELPETLRIRVQERKPLARVVTSEVAHRPVSYFIDTEGVLILPRSGESVEVPQIVGLKIEMPREGMKLENPELLAALSLLQRLDTSYARSVIDVAGVDLSKPRQLTLITQQGASIKFLTEYVETHIHRLEVILKFAQQNSRVIQTADLTIDQNVPVVFKP